MTNRTLFLKVSEDPQWTEDQLDNLLEAIDDAVGDDVSVVAVPNSVKYLNSEEVKQFGESIIEAVETND